MEENGAHFFEGTEKLLEVWFSRQDETKGTGDLRDIPRSGCTSPEMCSVFRNVSNERNCCLLDVSPALSVI
ncbi:DCAM decarboxylase, partial [Polyodon spathula]|nr:DCAM decarboxylase [Polyodon spathula]